MTYTVSWRFNGHQYYESFPSLIQAMLRYWKLNDLNAGIHFKE